MITATLHTDVGSETITSETWHKVIIARGYDGIIFDCDGTLVESADVHFASFAQAAEAQGRDLDRAWYLARTGLDRISLFHEFAKTNDGFEIDLAVSQSIANFIKISDRVKAIPQIEMLVTQLSKSHALAVGTNAEKPVAQASLRATGMLGYFAHIVAVSDGLAPKPAPDIFAKAALLLGSPGNCLVIEDSPQGVNAAKAAGLDVIEIHTAH